MTKEEWGHWEFFRDFEPSEWVGFIYKITDVVSGRSYIGKKLLKFTTRKAVKGKTNKKKVVKTSDWTKYMGSSKWLLEEISLYGKERFKFEIISLHESRSTLAWAETKFLVEHDALRAKLSDGTKAYYNGLVCAIKYKVNDDTEKEKLYRVT